MHLITRAFLMAGSSSGYSGGRLVPGWNRAQLAAIGVSWPPRAKWISRIVGRGITDEAAEDFIALKGNAGRVRPRKSPEAA